VRGSLYNLNTVEKFRAVDREALVGAAAVQVWEDICSGAAEHDPALLGRFVMVSFADLKKFSFFYWFAFPALHLPGTPVTITSAPLPLAEGLPALASDVVAACEAARGGSQGAGSEGGLLGSPAAWIIHLGGAEEGATPSAFPLAEFPRVRQAGGEVLLAFLDPCNLPGHPGWPLRTLLLLASVRWRCDALRVLCVREKAGRVDAARSLLVDVRLPAAPLGTGAGGWGAPGGPSAVPGWEANARGNLGPRAVHLGPTMDPRRLAESAVNLNLKLMRWRALPELDTAALGEVRCLLLGAGTLGCAVARTLMGWGVRRITLCDAGNVAYSNPVRQSLFEFDDCLSGGRPKAEAAAERLARIFPGAEAQGVQLQIPMPGHPVGDGERTRVLDDVAALERLVREHDAVFLLTDTRESRWLPTLLAAHTGTIALNAALGFDGYLVMRHGGAALSAAGADVEGRLGCYFCNDVVAPLDSTADRTLDQQCTVTRPGLAPIAAALAVELGVSLLQHPARGSAPPSGDGGVLGACPHIIRGSVRDYQQVVVRGEAFAQCTGCSACVVREYRARGAAFLMDAFSDPSYLEDLTGLTQLHQAAEGVDWDVASDGEEGGGDDDEWTEL